MTSQGSAHGRFERAIANRHMGNALIAARELGELSPVDALELCLLLAEVAPERYSPAAARWHAKFALRARGISRDESQLALAALRLLPEEREGALRALLHLARRHGVQGLNTRRH